MTKKDVERGSGRQHNVQHVRKGISGRHAHNDECRDRVGKLLMDEGAQRVETYFERARVREETGSGTATSSDSATVVTHAQTPKRKADDETVETDERSKKRRTEGVSLDTDKRELQRLARNSVEYYFRDKQVEASEGNLDLGFFPMIVPLQKNLAMIIMGGLFIQMVVLALWIAKPLLDGV